MSSTSPSTTPEGVAAHLAAGGDPLVYPWLPGLVQRALDAQVSRSQATTLSNARRAPAAEEAKAAWIDRRLALLPITRPAAELVPLVQNAARFEIRRGECPLTTVPGKRIITARIATLLNRASNETDSAPCHDRRMDTEDR